MVFELPANVKGGALRSVGMFCGENLYPSITTSVFCSMRFSYWGNSCAVSILNTEFWEMTSREIPCIIFCPVEKYLVKPKFDNKVTPNSNSTIKRPPPLLI